jgi:hypothetical protein
MFYYRENICDMILQQFCHIIYNGNRPDYHKYKMAKIVLPDPKKKTNT